MQELTVTVTEEDRPPSPAELDATPVHPGGPTVIVTSAVEAAIMRSLGCVRSTPAGYAECFVFSVAGQPALWVRGPADARDPGEAWEIPRDAAGTFVLRPLPAVSDEDAAAALSPEERQTYDLARSSGPGSSAWVLLPGLLHFGRRRVWARLARPEGGTLRGPRVLLSAGW